MSEFRLPAAPKVRTIKVTGIVRRRCDLGPIWGRNTAEVEKVHGQNVRNFSAQILEVVCADLRKDLRKDLRSLFSIYRMGLSLRHFSEAAHGSWSCASWSS